jgi:hypothetical protein
VVKKTMAKGCENTMSSASEMKLAHTSLTPGSLRVHPVKSFSRLAKRFWSFWLSKIPLGYQDETGFHPGKPPV